MSGLCLRHWDKNADSGPDNCTEFSKNKVSPQEERNVEYRISKHDGMVQDNDIWMRKEIAEKRFTELNTQILEMKSLLTRESCI